MEMQPYLARLCEALSNSMIGEDQPVILKVVGEGGIATCRNAERLGLIVTELVINSLKYAFKGGDKRRTNRRVLRSGRHRLEAFRR